MKLLGYIVCDASGAMSLQFDPWFKTDKTFPRKGLLVSGNFGSVFKSRDSARRALERTAEYEKRNHLFWQSDSWRIQRIYA